MFYGIFVLQYLVTCLVSKSVIIFQIRLARLLHPTIVVHFTTAVRISRAVNPSLYSDLVAQVRKISTCKVINRATTRLRLLRARMNPGDVL